MWHCTTLFGFHPWGWIFQILFWGALILFILWAVKGVTRHGSSPSAPFRDEAAAILANRFARGEISPEEYRQAKQTLTDR